MAAMRGMSHQDLLVVQEGGIVCFVEGPSLTRSLQARLDAIVRYHSYYIDAIEAISMQMTVIVLRYDDACQQWGQ